MFQRLRESSISVSEKMWLIVRASLGVSDLHQGIEPAMEAIDSTLANLPLVIAADSVSVPFRAQAGTPEGKIRFQEVKIALLARLRSVQTRSAQTKTRLEQRRLVAVLGNIAALQPRLHLEALR
jgi:hypothetical protein